MLFLKNYFLRYIWRPIFCIQYLNKTFNLRKTEYCILQKLYELLGTDNIIWFNYTFDFAYDEYMVIYEYMDPTYNTVIKGHLEFSARIFNRTFEE